MEKTLPTGVSESATFSCIEGIMQHKEEYSDHDCPPATTAWNADGSMCPREMKAQMVQHCKALNLVSSWSHDPLHILSASSICALQKTLMLHSTDANGSPLLVGEIRTCGAFTTGHIYPEASMERLQQAVDRYYLSLERKDHFLISAAILFYEVIQAHPFQDGNGRVCRLLLNYALRRAGFPFAVPLTSGHSKARKHYILAIQGAQNRDGLGLQANKMLVDLVGLILKSCYYKVINYEANMARMV